MKRKKKAQIYRDYKYNIKMFAWNILYLLENKEAMKHNPKAHDTLVTSAIKIVISIEVSQPQCRMCAPLYDVSRCIHQGCKWHYKKFSENAGVQGLHRPWWGQGATPSWGAQGGQRSLGETEFSHFYSLKIGLSWTEVG